MGKGVKMSFRPDELANRAEIERDIKKRQMVQAGATLAGSTALSMGYGPIAQKILPFLTRDLPLNVAMKGIQKYAPQVSDFLKKGQNMGLDIGKGMDFVKNSLATKVSEESKPLFERLIGNVDISSLSKAAQKKLESLVPIANQLEKKGRKEGDAEVVKLKKQIDKILKQLSGSDKLSIDNIIKGAENLPSLSSEQEELQDAIMGQMDEEQQVPQPQPVQGEPQPGKGQQALMEILQKIQAARGASG
jgi:hypothetical protein